MTALDLDLTPLSGHPALTGDCTSAGALGSLPPLRDLAGPDAATRPAA